ncbi:MAG: ATP-binding cassette domain-containing protein [Candidatus Eremiobacteraeota bacterium]|nr:ATP-binding cassette domain-containing protein [Candidatus Eremiobacteraeota bacterium]
MIDTITILGGKNKSGEIEPVQRLELKMGTVVSIVGPTGSGKTTLINDIELFADGTTPTGRKILINGLVAPPEFRDDPSMHPVAHITQHTTFLSDLPVKDFLETHARIRSHDKTCVSEKVERTLGFANQLTGEPIIIDNRMTELSGGQTRALLIADATILCEAPVILLDEVENAGINRSKALELLRKFRKIFVFVTHDPRISLLADIRVVMKNGAIMKILEADEEEKKIFHTVIKLDNILAVLREKIRFGERLTVSDMEGLA